LWKQFENEYKPEKEDKNKSPYEALLVKSKKNLQKLDNIVAIFTRDSQTSLQVWSGKHGYPGDGSYLDFHKKHFPGGHKYWKITSSEADLADKQIYIKQNAEERLKENAAHFNELVNNIINDTKDQVTPYPFVCSAFDTELFGHWWHEGPQWMYKVIKLMHKKSRY